MKISNQPLRPFLRPLLLVAAMTLAGGFSSAAWAQASYGATGGEGNGRGGHGGAAGQPGLPGANNADTDPNIPPSSGGVAGTVDSPNGGEGGAPWTFDGGGGGGGGGYSPIVSGNIDTAMQGGHGGKGGDSSSMEGGGGAGGDGARNEDPAAELQPFVVVTANVTGGDGGEGGEGGYGAGSGGGGAGIVVVNSGHLVIEAMARVAGGNGGASGPDQTYFAGGGGGAGVSMSENSVLAVHGQVLGGDGGGYATGGAGVVMGSASHIDNRGSIEGGRSAGFAPGGAGIMLLEGGTVINLGQITGADGDWSGSGGSNTPSGGTGSGGAPGKRRHVPSRGTGGAGIEGANLNVINAGTIKGGRVETNPAFHGNAITFTGGDNRLELLAGFEIIGNVDATDGMNNTLVLGGSSDATFDASALGGSAPSYLGFEVLQKAGSGTWTLTEDGAGFSGESQILGGTLRILGQLGGTLSVHSGGTLTGTGMLAGLAVEDGGTVAPGDQGAGVLAVGGDLALAGGAQLFFELGAPASARIDVAGDVLLAGLVRIIPGAGFGVGQYTLIQYLGEFSGVLPQVDGSQLPQGLQASIEADPVGKRIVMTIAADLPVPPIGGVQPVPTLSAWALALLGGMLGLLARRRRA